VDQFVCSRGDLPSLRPAADTEQQQVRHGLDPFRGRDRGRARPGTAVVVPV
jgi:hypothetical protein